MALERMDNVGVVVDDLGKKRTLTISCLAHVVQDGLSATIYVLLPVLAQVFGLTLAEVGLFKGLKNLTQGVLEVLSGIASEWFGNRALLVFGLAMSGTGYVLFLLPGGVPLLVVCLIIVGIGTAFQHAPASALVSAAYADGGRRGALGLYNSSGDAGKLAFTMSFSLALGAGIAWSLVATAIGLVALVAAAIALAMLGREAPTPATDGAAVTGWGMLDRPAFAMLLGAVFLDSLVQASALTFIAFLMLDKGAPLSIATFAASAILVGGIFGKAACGFLADRIGVRAAFSLIQTLTAAGIVGMVFAPIFAGYLLLPVLGVVLQGSTSITYSIVNDLVHQQRAARGFALIYAASSFSAVAGPVGFGLLGDAYGIETAILAMAVFALLAILPCVFLPLRAAYPVPGQ